MKSGWVTKKLGEVCELINGKNQSEVSDPNGKYPIYGSGGVMGHATDFRCPAGCTIIGRKGSINNPIFVNEEFWNVDTAYALSPKDVNERWLFYFCRSFDFSALDCGTTIPSLTSTLVKNVDIPIPPLAEQKRIVAKIDAAFEKIDALKANAEKNLANAKELFQSALDDAMRPKPGWVEKRLGEVCETTSGGTPLKSRPEYYEGGTIPWLRSGEVCRKEITESEMFITKLGMANSSAKLMPKDTVLIAMYGATAAQVGILRFASTTNQAVCGILPNEHFLPEFLYYYFKKIEPQLAARAQGGAQPNISQQKIKETNVPVIPLAEQCEIVKRLDFLSEKIKLLDQNYARQIADCAEMRQAILREAFEGRL